jgi:hypothetical protein
MTPIDRETLFAAASVALLVVGYYPYIRDTLKRETQPHIYTWIIWAITGGTATAAAFIGGGSFGAYSMAFGTALVMFVALLATRYGTHNITRSDTLILILAASTICIWWLTANAYLAVLLVTLIDSAGYIPTLRKSWVEPWSETLSFWATMTMVSVLTIFSFSEWNWLTVPYIATLAILNLLVVAVCLIRRRSIPAPKAI